LDVVDVDVTGEERFSRIFMLRVHSYKMENLMIDERAEKVTRGNLGISLPLAIKVSLKK